MSRQAYPTQLRDHLGNDVRLPPKPFAVGGEGAVFDVLGRPDLVAKLYSKPQSKDRCDKLRAMVKLCSPDLLQIAAWPTATLNAGNPAGVDGILMPKVMGHLEIHHLYSVAQRRKDFPEADWGFLLHTARNCAIAFEAVHGHGHVVGDVNQKNLMVSKKGIVAFVDCDSFQVTEGTRIFRCGVGVAEYTPPELHGKNFATLDRAANHDLFGLAVLVFHLLMMGRHPFSGVPLVKADIPIEKAIQEGCYAYTRNTATARLKPPPHVPPMTMLDPSVLDLFERAFGSARRPTATEWRTSLDAAVKQLARCKNDPKHSYLATAGRCPWCELIAVARLMFFLPGQGAAATPFRPEDIQHLIHKLAGMQITFTPYTRPGPTLTIQATLPAGLRSVQKPSLLPRPAPPLEVQKPTLTPLPRPPSLVPRPPLKPLPAAILVARMPPLMPYPPARPIEKPALKPHPPAPAEPPRPNLKPVPRPPKYPPLPTPGPPDPFLPRLCVAGMVGGFFVSFIAMPVGFIMIAAFAAWWVLMLVTEDQRRGMTRKSLEAAHQFECDRMDERYAEICQPIEEANKRLAAAWQATKSATTAEYKRLCKAVNDENYRRLAAFEAADAAQKAEFDRACGKIDVANRRVLAAWEARNAAQMAEHERARNEIDQANRRVLTGWEAENAARQAEYDRAREKIQSSNQRLIEAWEAVKAARQEEHDRSCREVDASNRRLIAAWEAANTPWIAEEQRWRNRVAEADAEIRRLEAEFNAQRSAIAARFQQRKDEANGIVPSHNGARRDYENELKQAKVDSKKIQLEEHLDKSLIRQAKIKGITSDRILSLESFGIETAKDVPILNNQKVPGIGPVLSGRLFTWRASLASSFVPKQELPESEKKRIASRYAPVLLPLVQSIQGAIQDLEVIVGSHRAREGELLKAIGAAVRNAVIAEAHVRAMKLR